MSNIWKIDNEIVEVIEDIVIHEKFDSDDPNYSEFSNEMSVSYTCKPEILPVHCQWFSLLILF